MFDIVRGLHILAVIAWMAGLLFLPRLYAYDAEPTDKPLVILYAHDLEAMDAKVRAAGGRVIKPIFSFPGGRRFHFKDPSGNEMAVWSEGQA